MILGRHILVIFTIFQKNGLLVEIGHFEAFPANFGVTDLTLGDSRVAPKGFFLLHYPYPVPKLLAETFFGLGPDLVHLNAGGCLGLLGVARGWLGFGLGFSIMFFCYRLRGVLVQNR